MDIPMAISGEMIKSLREAKAWSQAHLAEAAGLSLRTVQRVENEGTASAETRMAIAGALGVAVEKLNAPKEATVPSGLQADLTVETTSGIPLVFGCSAAVLLFVLWVGSGLPPTVASHFGAVGDANDRMSRDGFIAVMGLLSTVVPSAMLAAFTYVTRRGKLNLPNGAFWLAPERRAATTNWLHRHFSWLCMGLSLFMGWLTWLVALANQTSPPAMKPLWIVGSLAVVLASTSVWMVVLQRRFSRKPA